MEWRRIRALEKELQAAREEQKRASLDHWDKGKAKSEEEVLSQHQKLKLSLAEYVRDFRILVVLTAPIIYLGGLAFCLLDFVVLLYQVLCFPIYGVPRVKRSDYVVFDRGRLKYLNVLERFNCDYCSYVNGMCAYVTEVAARTEQYWCPIKHALRPPAPHTRYSRYVEYGDAQQYRTQGERVRNDFVDVRSLTSIRPGANGK